MIEVEHLTKRYAGRTAVDDVSFSVKKGEIVGFLGPNGAGKSTTLRMLTGFLAPSAGRIRIDGVDMLERPLEAKRAIGYMPEACPLYPEMRVSEYLRYRAELKGVARAHVRRNVSKALEQASVTEVEDRIIGQLSKGTRQRVGIADALVGDPRLLVLDEPTAGLDPNQIKQVRDLVRRFAGDKTVLVSTHILPEVEATCGRVVIIHKGQIVREGSPDELRASRTGGRKLVLKTRHTAAEIQGALAGVPGVLSVSGSAGEGGGPFREASGIQRVTLTVTDDDEVSERVFTAIAAAGLTLRTLQPVSAASLEDVFTHLTTRDTAAGDDEDDEDDEDGDGADGAEGEREEEEDEDAAGVARDGAALAAGATAAAVTTAADDEDDESDEGAASPADGSEGDE